MIVVALATVAIAAALLALTRTTLVVARMFQIEEYEGRRLFSWSLQRTWCLHRAFVVYAIVVWCGAVIALIDHSDSAVVLAAAVALAGVFLNITWSWVPPKKQLVYTPRIRRLLAAVAAMAVVEVFAAIVLAQAVNFTVLCVITILIAPLMVMWSIAHLTFANTLLWPVEAHFRHRFLVRARNKMRMVKPDVIAVAGSYGKTTTKHLLVHCLSPYPSRIPVVGTPKSFNTLMGVSRAINDTLTSDDRTFVVEMDAYGRGEIAALCALVQPRIVVITAVGPQHLERFLTMKNVEDALYESIASLPSDGVAVVYGGDEESMALARRARADGRTTVVYGIEEEAAGDLDICATDVKVTGHDVHFTWRWRERGLTADVTVPLLGRHQVLNATAVLGVVAAMEEPLDAAVATFATMQPVEHRLQPIATGNGITVIDDAYNANPTGVHNALEVLEQIEARHRILVTPGLVELGSVEEAENRRYGQHAAQVCTHVIVVDAEPAASFCAGLADERFPADRTHVVASLDDATILLGKVAGAGDVVLFANDLPDTYTR